MSGQTPVNSHSEAMFVLESSKYGVGLYITKLETDLSEAVAALKERDKLWCAAIIATQEAPGREPLTCDVQKLLAYFNSHKPPVQ